MGDYLYGRTARVTISLPEGQSFVDTDGANTITINAGATPAGDNSPRMRVKFKIVRTQQKEPNNCELTVVNLSRTHREAAQKKGTKLELEAGYLGSGLSRIWRGDVRTADPIRNGADWDTLFKMGDGERAFRFARVNESFAPGTKASDILRFLGNASGLAIGNIPDVVLNLTTDFQQGYVVSGWWRDEMDRFLRGTGYSWSIQDEVLQVLPPGGYVEADVPLISPETGLIGSPEMGNPEKKGQPALVKYRSLLRPSRPGQKERLKSSKYDGFVRVKKATLSGDTQEGDYFTDCEGVIIGT